MYSLSATLTAIKNQIQHRPVEIHDIYLGSQTAEDSNTLHFVNFYRAITFFTYLGYASQSYTPLAVNRTALKKTSRGEIERISYRIDNVNKAMGAYAAAHDFRNKRVVTRLIFRSNLTSYLDCKIIFDGFIQAILFEKNSMSATCVPKLGSLNFEPGWPYQIQCNTKFGDEFCTINKNASENKLTGTATGGTAATLIDTVNLIQVDDYWNWGVVTFTNGLNNGDSRKINDFDQATGKVTLDYALDNAIIAGDTYIIYRGCDKTLNMCVNTYNNAVNFHGFHTIPLTK